jgi:hypothetical protein
MGAVGLCAFAARSGCATKLTPTVAEVDGQAIVLVEAGEGDTHMSSATSDSARAASRTCPGGRGHAVVGREPIGRHIAHGFLRRDRAPQHAWPARLWNSF